MVDLLSAPRLDDLPHTAKPPKRPLIITVTCTSIGFYISASNQCRHYTVVSSLFGLPADRFVVQGLHMVTAWQIMQIACAGPWVFQSVWGTLVSSINLAGC
jgi:hypothetical protein